MKYLVTLLIGILFSQMMQSQESNELYDVLWKKVQKLENEALPKSAIKVVGAISEKAKMEGNSSQIVKALLYTSKYIMTLEEDAQLKIVNDFRSEIAKAEFPTKNILESYLANLFWQFFQQNRYQFYYRTKTEVKTDPSIRPTQVDFRTWDLTTLFNEVNAHFDASLKNPSELQKIEVSEFDLLLDQQPGSKIYRPTLFDLLAHTALQFYKTSENNVDRPADKFEIDDQKLICEVYTYTQIKISIEDQTSLQAKALQIYQQLLQFHFSDPKLEALVDVDIERLNYIYQNAVLPEKDQIYFQVLQNSAESLKHHEISALYTYEIAQLYHQQGNTYQGKTNTEQQWKQKEAVALCESVIAQFPDSRAADKCKALMSQILAKSLQLTTEGYIPINTPARFLVNYKNYDGLQLTAHKISQSELKKLNELYPQPKQLAFIQKLAVAKKWEADLRDERDYQPHSTEILLPPLPNGQYVILATSKDQEERTFAFSPIQITDLALVQTQTPTQDLFQVIDRNNGHPIPEATLKFTYTINYKGPLQTRTFVSDETGMSKMTKSLENWNSINVKVGHPDDSDHAFFGEYHINQDRSFYGSQKQDLTYSCFLFTDRSIYRPGQPVYFKGILIEEDEGISKVSEKESVIVGLYDANGQRVSEMNLETNDFGSFTGEFILPNSGLTGEYHIEVHGVSGLVDQNYYFSVEEYKRPKFETSFKPVSGVYKVNDSVTVQGTAKAYAGSYVTDGKVMYRVKRVVYFPRWYYWHHPYYKSTPQEIAHGETTTNASGNYKIDFLAIPDNSIDGKDLPTFQYEVTADVTDINGETHSTSSIIAVGYHTLTATISVPGVLNKNAESKAIGITTNNLNGQFVAARGTLKIYKRKAPEFVLRPRPWAAPDYKSWNKQEFKRLFPNDAYDDEHNSSNWERGKLVWESTFDTEKSKEISLTNSKKWASGKYIIELETKDKFGQIVTDVAQTMLYDPKDKQLADNQLFHITTDKPDYDIGDKAEVTLLSNAKDLTVTIFVEKGRKITDKRIIHLGHNSESFTVPINADDLGGFTITYSFSAYNSFQAGNLNISVPYAKTDLEIETQTFRDKLQPGGDETWSFKIKGPNGDQVTAELLASMYDASLDAFRGQYWNFHPLARPIYYSNNYSNASNSFGTHSFSSYNADTNGYHYKMQNYDTFNWFGLRFGYGRYYSDGLTGRMKNAAPAAMEMIEESESLDEVVITGMGEVDADTNKPEEKGSSFDHVQIRKNLQETAFFLPQLRTDEAGNVSFSFTTPEALTQWKLQLLAHTKSLESAMTIKETVTQKELMVIPNFPRFLREGDEITIRTKIANLTDNDLTGRVKLELVDAMTGKGILNELPTLSALGNSPQKEGSNSEKSFQVDSLGNTQVSWRLKIPEGINAVQYRIIATAGDFSDGEQNLLPVLTNRTLVTETMPLWVRDNQTKTFVLEKLKDHTSTSLKHHKLSLEITSNPAWYAVQALPYLMEYPYECNEQTFARYYANALASHIANTNPRIKEVFDQWRNSDALLSNLEENGELKSILIQETPWLRDAQSETEQKKRLALLFDLNKMRNEQANALRQLQQNQMPSGAWPWFKGGRANRYITQHIITGLGHLKQLTLIKPSDHSSHSPSRETQRIIENAISYLDAEFVKEYDQMKMHAKNLKDDHLSPLQIQYLYMRSFFKEVKTSNKVEDIIAYYKGQAHDYWVNRKLYPKGMLALALYRMNDVATANKILHSLKENSITSEKLGMYWKENKASWHWYQAPVETQALMIEVFSEIQNDTKAVDDLKVWLLKNKQTSQWRTTKATTEAVYALLLQGNDWLSVTDAVGVHVGNLKVEPETREETKVEAGTGYFKTSWNGNEINAEMAEVYLTKKSKGIAWGALYWQYFEDLDKITTAETPLKLEKKLFLKKNTATGEEISEITTKTDLKIGDLIQVRIELRVDRDMEYIHLKDMRAAGFEPINVISSYKWQDGLGYYESTKDASTNFFFDLLPKGIFIFEYDLRVNNAGDFSNGITTIQSLYAPEFNGHSKGNRVTVN